jgi:uncharacterized protein YjbI with pentapeptide repeats
MAAGNPTKENGVWKNVDPNNVQALLDGEYGPIDNTTIELSAGDYSKIEFGRATEHKDSNTKYYLSGAESNVDKIRDDIIAHPNGGAGQREYVRYMSNVTLKAADNAEVNINGLVAFGGQVNSNKWYSRDFVADRNMDADVNNNISYWIVQNWSNITFEGITFTKAVDIVNSLEKTNIDGVSFKNCKFNINNITETETEYYGIRFYSDFNNGQLKNLVVDNCVFNGCRLAVYTHHVYNISVTNSKFDTTGHNAIAIQDSKGACDHGNVVIIGNTFKDIGDRIIRFNNVGEGTTITISNNTSVNSGASNGEIIKATTLPEGMEVTMTNNNWGKVGDKDPVIGNGFIETTTGGTIVIITPTEDTPKTEPEKNPTTGANDMVAAAVALMAVSALGMAVLFRKK